MSIEDKSKKGQAKYCVKMSFDLTQEELKIRSLITLSV